MDLILSARMMDAAEAERGTCVARSASAENLLAEALKIGATIASFSLPAVLMAKESINRAYELPLSEGVLFERRLFHSLFATADQKEGMAAFVEKRAQIYTGSAGELVSRKLRFEPPYSGLREDSESAPALLAGMLLDSISADRHNRASLRLPFRNSVKSACDGCLVL